MFPSWYASFTILSIMRLKYFLLISSLTLFIGFVFYGIYNELILIRLPGKSKVAPLQGTSTRKTMKVYYAKKDQWGAEDKEILVSSSLSQTLTNLITTWLNLLEEEGLMKKKVSIQSIMIDENGKELYLSFDRNPLAKEHATYQKLLWIEGLLKTIRESGLPVQSVRFLVYTKPLNDPHLDFTYPWPVTGYKA